MKFRKNSITEVVIFLLVMVALNITFFYHLPAYRDISPHPYLVIVALIASLYGIKEGLVACVLSALTFIFQLSIMDKISLVSVFNNFLNLRILFLLFSTAIGLGEIKEIYNREKESLSSSLRETRDKLDKFQLKYETVKTAKDELETRIIGQSASVLSLYEATKALETLERDKIYTALLNLIVKFIGAKKCSVYLIDDKKEKLINAGTSGWQEGEKAGVPQIDINKGVLGWVIREEKPLTVRDIQEDSELKKMASESDIATSMICAPVKIRNKTVGVVNIEEIPFVKLTASAVRTLSILVDLASPAIENALVYEQAKDKDIYDPVTNLIKYSYFFKRSEEELKRAIRYNLNFSLLIFEIDFLAEILKTYGEEDKNEILRKISKAIISQMRNIDLISRHSKDGRFVILLPLTDLHGGFIFAERLSNFLESATIKLKEGEMRIAATFGLSGYQYGVKNIDTVIERAARALEEARRDRRKISIDKGE